MHRLLLTALGALVFVGCDERVTPEGGATRGTSPPAAEPGDPRPTAAPLERKPNAPATPSETEARSAEADIESAEGMDIDGEAKFSQDGSGVKIVLNVENAPAGNKGVHIHEKGDCSNIRGESTGSHFAPEGDKHALPSEKPQGERHFGDLGNIQIEQDGKGRLEFTLDKATLKKGEKYSLIGRAIVVHESNDVGASKQPSAGSGKPVACGVIEAS